MYNDGNPNQDWAEVEKTVYTTLTPKALPLILPRGSISDFCPTQSSLSKRRTATYQINISGIGSASLCGDEAVVEVVGLPRVSMNVWIIPSAARPGHGRATGLIPPEL